MSKNKYEKYLDRTKKYLESGDYRKALQSLKLIEEKDPEVLLYEIINYRLLPKPIQCYHKIQKLKELNPPILYGIIADQCHYQMIQVFSNSKENNARYEEILKDESTLKDSLNKNIKRYESEINKFLESHEEVFTTIFNCSILNMDERKKIKDNIIDIIKKDEKIDQDLADKGLSLLNEVDSCILSFCDGDYATFLEEFNKLKKDERLICKTMHGVMLYRQDKFEDALAILYSVIKEDREDNIKAYKYYTYAASHLNCFDKIIEIEDKLKSLDICQGEIIEANGYQAHKNKDYLKAEEYITKAIKFNPEKTDLLLFKANLHFYYLESFAGGIKILYKLAISMRDDIKINKEIRKYCLSLLNRLKNKEKRKERLGLLLLYKKILQLCNILLILDKNDEEIKKEKLRIIDNYQGKEDKSTKLTLNHIITEIRLTEDTEYLKFIVRGHIQEMDWERALYCIEAVLAYEPDNKEMLELKEKALESSKHYKPVIADYFKRPKGELIIADANIWISKIIKDIPTDEGVFKITNPLNRASEEVFGKLSNDNTMVMTPTTIGEIDKHLNIQLGEFKKTCLNTRFGYSGYKEIFQTLMKRKEHLINGYKYVNQQYNYMDMGKIRKFFHDRLVALEPITKRKIMSANPSQNIRKLVQREGYLPELNDRKILSEAITIKNESGKKVGILSYDPDFTEFAGDIHEKFGVKVYSVDETIKLISKCGV